MKLERKKNSVRNIKYGFLNKIITILFPFIMRTILIYTLGTEYLGLSSLFTSILQVLSLTELGIGSAMVFELYEPIAKNNVERICKLQNLYKIIYRMIGITILVIGICLLPFLSSFIKGNVPNDINIYILYILYLLNTSASYLLFAYKTTILTAYQRRDIISNIGTITHVVLYGLQIACLLNFKNYYTYVIWLPIFTIIENVAKAIYVKKLYPQYKPEGKLDKKEIKMIFLKVKDLFGHKLSSVVTNSVDTIVISSFLGLNMVTVYNNYYYLMSAIAGFLDIIYQGVLAGIGNSLVSETKEKNRADFNKFLLINSWMVSWCTVCFLVLYQPMIELWMGKDMLLPFDTIILLCLYFYVWKIRQTVLVYKDAAGMWKIDNKKPYIEILVNLLLNIILVNVIGVNGVVISTIVSMVFVSLIWESKALFKHYFGESSKSYFKKLALYFGVTVMLCVITYLACSWIKLGEILGFIIKICTCIIVPNVLFVLIFYKNKDFKNAMSIVLSIRKGKK